MAKYAMVLDNGVRKSISLEEEPDYADKYEVEYEYEKNEKTYEELKKIGYFNLKAGDRKLYQELKKEKEEGTT